MKVIYTYIQAKIYIYSIYKDMRRQGIKKESAARMGREQQIPLNHQRELKLKPQCRGVCRCAVQWQCRQQQAVWQQCSRQACAVQQQAAGGAVQCAAVQAVQWCAVR